MLNSTNFFGILNKPRIDDIQFYWLRVIFTNIQLLLQLFEPIFHNQFGGWANKQNRHELQRLHDDRKKTD